MMRRSGGRAVSRRAAATAAVILAGSLAAIGPPGTALAACGWHRVPLPAPHQLLVAPTSVDALSVNDAWAVGLAVREGPDPAAPIFTPLTWHWNGTAWSQTPHAHLEGANEELLSVAMVSARNVWAVGFYTNVQRTTINRTLVHHWNGTKWSVVPSPNVGTKSNQLVAVDSISANDVWAVGGYTDAGDVRQSLIEHWDGHTWTVVAHPAVTPPEEFADAVRIPGTSRAWAVGNTNDSNKTLVQRSLGTTWVTEVSPNQGAFPSVLDGVTATSATDAWAVGHYTDGVRKTLAERWNGSDWSIVPSPNAGTEGSYLTEVASRSGTNAWALGSRSVDGIDRVLAERWNGTVWRVIPFPTIGVADNGATDLGAIPGQNSAWATGIYRDNDGFRPLVARYC
jgi:hypothetical protein